MLKHKCGDKSGGRQLHFTYLAWVYRYLALVCGAGTRVFPVYEFAVPPVAENTDAVHLARVHIMLV